MNGRHNSLKENPHFVFYSIMSTAGGHLVEKSLLFPPPFPATFMRMINIL